MTAIGGKLALRLFLEGVELPVVAATINSQKNAAAQASIQIPANDYGLDLRPRTLVHLFAYDGYRGTPAEQAVHVAGPGIRIDPDKEPRIPTAQAPAADPDLTRVDLENANYKLIFGGEVVGVSYQKTPSSRAMTLQCVDWSSYWDIAYQYMVSGMSLTGGGLKAAFTGANTTVFNDFLEGSGDIVLKLLSTPPRSYPKLKGTLLGGIMHLIEAIGGCYFGARSVKGINDFFSLAEMRLHITQMVGANPDSATDELRLLRANGFGTLFSKQLGGLGKMVTVRQVLLALQRYIFHEVVPITAPMYHPPRQEAASTVLETARIAQDPTTAPLAGAAKFLKDRALELSARQRSSTGIDEAQKQSSFRGGLDREFERMGDVASDAQLSTRKAQLKVGASTSSGGLTEVAAGFEVAARQFRDLKALCMPDISGAGYTFPLARTSDGVRVEATLMRIAERMQLIMDATYQRPTRAGVAQPDPPARLLTQIYRPDVWMVAPPRCNVIFPELYSQFSYGRNFLNEVSRILLRTHEAFYGSDVLFDGFYMAPSRLLGARKGKPLKEGRVGIEPPDMSDAPAWVVKDMLDHELYTGITPTFERMSDLNLHAIRGGSIEINGAKVGYAQLACNHIFFQMRFRSRELMCSGRFNPYAVLGFPMVIIDKYKPDDELYGLADGKKASELAKATTPYGVTGMAMSDVEERGLDDLVSGAGVLQQTLDIMQERPLTHFLGTPAMISHSISSSVGGTTQYQMDYARTTNERTEFLGDNFKSAKAKKTGTQRVPTVIAALEPPRVGTKGIRGGRIAEVKDVTDQYGKANRKKTIRKGSEKFVSNGTMFPLFVRATPTAQRKRRGTQVPVGVELPARAYGPEVVALVGSGGTTSAAIDNVLVTFRAFRIVEEMGVYTRSDVPLPPEEITFPPWYGEAYRTANIGGLYSYYFGVGSIVDPTVVLGSKQPRKTDGERTLYVELSNNMGTSSTPEPGLSDIPEAPGGGMLGPPDEAEGQEVLGQVEARSPIADAVAELVRIYSATRTQHYDTPSFVHNYTWRPIASMVDIFGTADLQISDTGVVTAGREGFHSRAFGDFDDLRQLVDSTKQTVLGLAAKPSETSKDVIDPSAKIASRLDTRKEKRLAVLRYLNALSASRGVLLG